MQDVSKNREEETGGWFKRAGVIQKLLNWIARGTEKEKSKGRSCRA
jgi:hypothetical protein